MEANSKLSDYNNLMKLEDEGVITNLSFYLTSLFGTEAITILDLGIGPGAISIPIFNKLKESVKSINWIGIDKNDKVKLFLKDTKISFKNLDIEKYVLKLSDKNLSNGINEKVNIIFAPFLFQHLVYWEKTLNSFLEKTNIFVDAVAGGEIPLLFGEWELIENLKNTNFKKKYKSLFEQSSYDVTKELTASRYGSLELILKLNNFKKTKEFIATKKWDANLLINAIKNQVFVIPGKTFKNSEIEELFNNENVVAKHTFRIWEKQNE